MGSTYPYLTVMRLNEVDATPGVRFNAPVQPRPIRVEHGNRPFTGKPVKTGYTWRDAKRRRERMGPPSRSGARSGPGSYANVWVHDALAVPAIIPTIFIYQIVRCNNLG